MAITNSRLHLYILSVLLLFFERLLRDIILILIHQKFHSGQWTLIIVGIIILL